MGFLQPIPLALRFSKVSADLIGPLGATRNGNYYALVMVDSFTGSVEIQPLPDKCAFTVARAMFYGWVCRHGVF